MNLWNENPNFDVYEFANDDGSSPGGPHEDEEEAFLTPRRIYARRSYNALMREYLERTNVSTDPDPNEPRVNLRDALVHRQDYTWTALEPINDGTHWPTMAEIRRLPYPAMWHQVCPSEESVIWAINGMIADTGFQFVRNETVHQQPLDNRLFQYRRNLHVAQFIMERGWEHIIPHFLLMNDILKSSGQNAWWRLMETELGRCLRNYYEQQEESTRQYPPGTSLRSYHESSIENMTIIDDLGTYEPHFLPWESTNRYGHISRRLVLDRFSIEQAQRDDGEKINGLELHRREAEWRIRLMMQHCYQRCATELGYSFTLCWSTMRHYYQIVLNRFRNRFAVSITDWMTIPVGWGPTGSSIRLSNSESTSTTLRIRMDNSVHRRR